MPLKENASSAIMDIPGLGECPAADAAPFSPAEYVAEFKKHFGYRDDYWPNCDYKKVRDSLAGECAMRAPYDTAAREIEGAAVMLLVMSGYPEGVKAGKNLGDCMMEKGQHDQETLLKRMSKAYVALLSLPAQEEEAGNAEAQDAAAPSAGSNQMTDLQKHDAAYRSQDYKDIEDVVDIEILHAVNAKRGDVSASPSAFPEPSVYAGFTPHGGQETPSGQQDNHKTEAAIPQGEVSIANMRDAWQRLFLDGAKKLFDEQRHHLDRGQNPADTPMEDAMDAQSQMTDLQRHDAKYHPNGFDPTKETCKYRDGLAAGDAPDMLDPENVAGEVAAASLKGSDFKSAMKQIAPLVDLLRKMPNAGGAMGKMLNDRIKKVLGVKGAQPSAKQAPAQAPAAAPQTPAQKNPAIPLELENAVIGIKSIILDPSDFRPQSNPAPQGANVYLTAGLSTDANTVRNMAEGLAKGLPAGWQVAIATLPAGKTQKVMAIVVSDKGILAGTPRYDAVYEAGTGNLLTTSNAFAQPQATTVTASNPAFVDGTALYNAQAKSATRPASPTWDPNAAGRQGRNAKGILDALASIETADLVGRMGSLPYKANSAIARLLTGTFTADGRGMGGVVAGANIDRNGIRAVSAYLNQRLNPKGYKLLFKNNGDVAITASNKAIANAALQAAGVQQQASVQANTPPQPAPAQQAPQAQGPAGLDLGKNAMMQDGDTGKALNQKRKAAGLQPLMALDAIDGKVAQCEQNFRTESAKLAANFGDPALDVSSQQDFDTVNRNWADTVKRLFSESAVVTATKAHRLIDILNTGGFQTKYTRDSGKQARFDLLLGLKAGNSQEIAASDKEAPISATLCSRDPTRMFKNQTFGTFGIIGIEWKKDSNNYAMMFSNCDMGAPGDNEVYGGMGYSRTYNPSLASKPSITSLAAFNNGQASSDFRLARRLQATGYRAPNGQMMSSYCNAIKTFRQGPLKGDALDFDNAVNNASKSPYKHRAFGWNEVLLDGRGTVGDIGAIHFSTKAWTDQYNKEEAAIQAGKWRTGETRPTQGQPSCRAYIDALKKSHGPLLRQMGIKLIVDGKEETV